MDDVKLDREVGLQEARPLHSEAASREWNSRIEIPDVLMDASSSVINVETMISLPLLGDTASSLFYGPLENKVDLEDGEWRLWESKVPRTGPGE